MFQRWQHPGYAPKELSEKGSFGIWSDIYSFGMIGYVMRHGSFYEGGKAHDTFDRILIRCIKDSVSNQSFNIDVVLQELACCHMPARWLMKKPFFHIIGCFLFCLLSLLMHHLHIDYDASLYNMAILQHDYDKALHLMPTKCEAYQLKLQYLQQVDDKEQIKASLIELEKSMRQNKVDHEEAIIRDFIICCFACEDQLYYQKAEEYITYVTPENKEDAMVLELYRLIAKERQRQYPDNELKQEIQKQLSLFIMQDMDVLLNEKMRFGTQQLLRLFEFHMQDLHQKQLIRFITILDQLRLHVTTDLKMLDRIWVATMHQIVLQAYDENDVATMNTQLVIMRKERPHLIYMSDIMHRQYGFLYILEFTYGISDHNKSKNIQILDDALKEWIAITSQQEYDEQMIRKIEELKKEWGKF